MKKVLLSIAALAILPATASATIKNSRHDLSSSSTASVKSSTMTEICIFCHTPHKASSTKLLWNHTATLNTTFSWTDSTTTAGTTLITSGVAASPSARCLSCHDGSVALGDVGNAGGGAAGVIGGLANIASHTNASGQLTSTAYVIGSGGAMTGHHPIWIPYAGSGNTYNSVVSKAASGAGTGYYAATNSGCTSPTGLCTTESTNGAKIQLYLGASAGNYGMECGSCHDVHAESGNAYFLRVNNSTQSALCLACHNK